MVQNMVNNEEMLVTNDPPPYESVCQYGLSKSQPITSYTTSQLGNNGFQTGYTGLPADNIGLQTGNIGPRVDNIGHQTGNIGLQLDFYPQREFGYGIPTVHRPNIENYHIPITVIRQPEVGSSSTEATQPVPDCTVCSFIACLIFLPTGLLAIYYAKKSRTELANGNVEKARGLVLRAHCSILSSFVLAMILFANLTTHVID